MERINMEPEVKRKRGMPAGTIVREHETTRLILQVMADGEFCSANKIAVETGISWRTVKTVLEERLVPSGEVQLIDLGRIKCYRAVNPPGTTAQT